MGCAWQAYLNLLPVGIRQDIDRLGRDKLQELRLRIQMPPELITSQGSIWLQNITTKDDISFCINAATRYSPWAAGTISEGYVTALGGHRIGVCGDAVRTNDGMTGISKATSLCLRVARDFPGIAEKAAGLKGSILILGRPGSGKTTLLRDLIRRKSESGERIAVVDERGELFPQTQDGMCFPPGRRTDVLRGCAKASGIEMVLRNMSPTIIAVDEITAQADCDALIHAGWCGVQFLATAHASGKADLLRRPVYKPIVTSALFEWLLILQPDKSWILERF